MCVCVRVRERDLRLSITLCTAVASKTYSFALIRFYPVPLKITGDIDFHIQEDVISFFK